MIYEQSFVSQWWAAILAVNLQAEVALNDVSSPLVADVFEVNDTRGDGEPVSGGPLCPADEYVAFTIAGGVILPKGRGTAAGEIVSTFQSPAAPMDSQPAVVADAVGEILQAALPRPSPNPVAPRSGILVHWNGPLLQRVKRGMRISFSDRLCQGMSNIWLRTVATLSRRVFGHCTAGFPCTVQAPIESCWTHATLSSMSRAQTWGIETCPIPLPDASPRHAQGGTVSDPSVNRAQPLAPHSTAFVSSAPPAAALEVLDDDCCKVGSLSNLGNHSDVPIWPAPQPLSPVDCTEDLLPRSPPLLPEIKLQYVPPIGASTACPMESSVGFSGPPQAVSTLVCADDGLSCAAAPADGTQSQLVPPLWASTALPLPSSEGLSCFPEAPPFAQALPDPSSDSPAEVFPATREQLPTQPHAPICRFKVGSLSSLGDEVLPGVASLPECPRAAPDSAAELPGLSLQSRQGPAFQGSVPREPLFGEPRDGLVPTHLPAGPFVRPCHGRAPPTTFSEVQLLVAAQTAVYPAWLSGPLLNTPFGTLVRLAGPPPSVQEDALFTIFEKNTEALVKRWLPGWSDCLDCCQPASVLQGYPY